MAASSPDQSSDTHTPQQPAHAGKRKFWIVLLINFAVFFIVAVILLAILTYFKIIPSQWSTSFPG